MATFNSQTFNSQTFNVGAVAPTVPAPHVGVHVKRKIGLSRDLVEALIHWLRVKGEVD